MDRKTLLNLLHYVSFCDLKVRDYKVLLYVLSTIEDESNNGISYIKIKQKDLVEGLRLTISQVSNAIRNLCLQGIIETDPDRPLKNYIRLVNYTNTEIEQKLNKILYPYDED